MSFPPKMLTTPPLIYTACFLESWSQSFPPVTVALLPPTTKGRTPQRSAMMSSVVSGEFRRSLLLMLDRTNCRSSSVTPTSGPSTQCPSCRCRSAAPWE